MSAVDLDQLVIGREQLDDRSSGSKREPRIVIGTLVGLVDDGRSPLVVYPGQQGTAAISALSTVDLHGSHVGSQVVMLLTGHDPPRLVVLGRVRSFAAGEASSPPVEIEIEVDGERAIVTAKKQLVLRCGKASITLTGSGKILISGTYVSSHSTGTNRIKGGSIQLN
jgi:hypothetical protein